MGKKKAKSITVTLTKAEADCLLEAIEFVGEVAYDDEANNNELAKISNKVFKELTK